MRKSLLVFGVVTLAVGCRSTDVVGPLEANKALVRRAHAEVWSGGDMEAAAEIFAPDFVGHWTGRPDTHGRAELVAFVSAARKQFPDWNETVEQVVAEGDLVVTRFTSRGTFEGEPTPGRKVTMAEIAVFRIVDSTIVEQWTVADVLSMRQQLGTLETSAAESATEP